MRVKTDYLVLGSGLAGLFAALKAADHGDVAVVTKVDAGESNTRYAQGGIACVVDDEDSFEEHVADTLKAGAGLCKEDVVRSIVESGPARIRDLLDLGMHFTRQAEIGAPLELTDPDALDLGKEGGHSRRRVLHAGDVTGAEVVRVLLKACREHPRITFYEHFHALDLISSRRLDWDGPNRCLGAYALDCAHPGSEVWTFLSRFVILATGGAGKVYLYTSNPDTACGEGVAMAYRAYAEIANMEFFQFHPTCLWHPQAKSFLISEAVRGEGAILKIRGRDGQLHEFMDRYHEMGSLAPRDIVARAIDQEMKRTGEDCVFLDVRHHSEEYLRTRFPVISDTCEKYGYRMWADPLPVVPAAHYCCGGVRADVNGRTCVNHLYAVGEVACTGLHGANRLASNSLLEALVCGHNAVADSVAQWDDADTRHLAAQPSRTIPDWSSGDAVDADEMIVVSHNWDEIRRFMWDYVGIFRTDKRLLRAKARVRTLRKEIEHFYWDFLLVPDLIELRNLASVAEMIIDCALARHESIGLNYNRDYPVPVDPSTVAPETILHRPGFERTLH